MTDGGSSKIDDDDRLRIAPQGALARLRAFLAQLPLGPLRSALHAVYALLASNRSTVRIGADTLHFVLGTEPHQRVSDQAGTTSRETLLAFARLIEPGHLVADIGAHVGTYALVAAARSGSSGRVFAFEPAAESRAVLLRNLELNQFEGRVTVVQAAASDRNGQISFFVAGTDSQNTTIAPQPKDQARFQSSTVHALRVDDVFADFGRDPDVVKIDVEGAELAVLRGMQRIVRGKTRIICDLHPYAWPSCGHDWNQFRNWVEANGRVVVNVLTGEEVAEEWFGPVFLEPRTKA